MLKFCAAIGVISAGLSQSKIALNQNEASSFLKSKASNSVKINEDDREALDFDHELTGWSENKREEKNSIAAALLFFFFFSTECRESLVEL